MRPLLSIAFLLASFTSHAATLTSRVVRIVDGDTLVFPDQEKQQHRVRLAGIDTPERKQPFGKRATENLAQLTGNKPVRLEWDKKDTWKRIITKVWVKPAAGTRIASECPDAIDTNLEQIKAGLVWHYNKYANEQATADRNQYATAEVEAKSKKLGLWNVPCTVAPWEWRRNK